MPDSVLHTISQASPRASVTSTTGTIGGGIKALAAPAAALSPLASIITFLVGSGIEAAGSFFSADAAASAAEKQSQRSFAISMRQLDQQFETLKLNDRQFQEKIGLQKDQFKLLVKNTNDQLGLSRIQVGIQQRQQRATERLGREELGLRREQLGIEAGLAERRIGLQAAEALGRGVERGLTISRAQRAGRL